jgi:hypothetical protein
MNRVRGPFPGRIHRQTLIRNCTDFVQMGPFARPPPARTDSHLPPWQGDGWIRNERGRKERAHPRSCLRCTAASAERSRLGGSPRRPRWVRREGPRVSDRGSSVGAHGSGAFPRAGGGASLRVCLRIAPKLDFLREAPLGTRFHTRGWRRPKDLASRTVGQDPLLRSRPCVGRARSFGRAQAVEQLQVPEARSLRTSILGDLKTGFLNTLSESE